MGFIRMEAENESLSPLKVEEADSFRKRFLGLMGRKRLPQGQGLLLSPCSSVHMCFMRFAIDVVYLDEEFRILKIVHSLLPWIGMSFCLGARSALEIASGEADRIGLQVGMKLRAVEQRLWNL